MTSVLRSLNLAKQLKNVIVSPKNKLSVVPVRNGGSFGFMYRRGNTKDINARTEKIAEYGCAFAWWWFLWHCWHDYEMITGEFPNLFPETWTDEELGITNE